MRAKTLMSHMLVPSFLLGLVGAGAHAGVIRHDRDDADYLALANQSQFDSNVLMTITGGSSGSSICSGTLIHPEWILTAAHCFDRRGMNPSVTISSQANGFEFAFSSEVVIHPGWSNAQFTSGFDLALVRLSAPMTTIAPTQIYTGSSELGLVGTSVGYGRTGTGLTGDTQDLGTQRAGTNVIDALGSDRGWNPDILIADFDNPDDPADSTYGDVNPTDLEIQVAPGDSGGSLYIEVGGDYMLAGITSFINSIDGRPNADYGDMSAYTRVSSYADWINATIPAPSSLGLLAIGAIFGSRRRR